MFEGRELPNEFARWTLEERMASDARIAVYCAESAKRLSYQASLATRPCDKRSMKLQAAAKRNQVVSFAVRIEICLAQQVRLEQIRQSAQAL